ncbi:MAG: ribonuclease HII [Peptostreptococcaceae bacterium]
MKDKSVKEIKVLIEEIEVCEYSKYIEILELDERKSVKDLAKKLVKKLDNINKENERLELINEYENKAYKNGYLCVGGIDEAGRGPLAGPVVASVVIFKPNTKIEGLNDSKKLSEDKRNELFEIIKNEAIDYGIGIVNAKEVDELNILNATYEAMKKAVDMLDIKPDYLLMDACIVKDIKIDQEAIIKGDSKSISIAGASVLAKVTRDNIMKEYDREFPQYDFKKHKGYGTKDHYDAINNFGLCEIHRRSFLKNI